MAQGEKGLNLFRLMRLGKIVKLLRMSTMMQKLREPAQRLADYVRIDFHIYAELANLLLGFATAVHWMGCGNMLLSREFCFPDESWVIGSGLLEVDANRTLIDGRN